MRKDESRDMLQPLGAYPEVILPDLSRIFLDRSRRFASLAEGHSLAGWLSFLGRLTEIQHKLGQDGPPPPLPDEAPPASALKDRRPLEPGWRKSLAALARELAPHAPGPARETLEELQAMDGKALDTLADRVLRIEPDGRGARFLPFVAAALQLHWTALAAQLDPARLAPPASPGVCPCCGYVPVAGIVRMDGGVPRLRYLHCALCNTEWHLVRITCAFCGDSNHIAYYHLEDSDESTRAETCGACRSYLKIIYREKSPQSDPVADDLATLGLDLLVQEAGYERKGLNLLFTPGPQDEGQDDGH